jgi:hypothetical protein
MTHKENPWLTLITCQGCDSFPMEDPGARRIKYSHNRLLVIKITGPSLAIFSFHIYFI